MNLPFAVTHALREARSSWKRIGLYMGSITLGVAALVALNSLRTSVIASVADESRTLLGGDVRIGANRPFTPPVRALLDSAARAGIPVAEVTRVASMAFLVRTGQTRLVQVRSAAAGYPFYGAFETEPAGQWQTYRNSRSVLVDPALLVQLGARVGDTLSVGQGKYVIAGTIKDQATEISFQTALGPRVFLPPQYMAETGILTFGSLAGYEAYLKIPSASALEEFTDIHGPMLRAEQARMTTADRQARQLTRALDNLTRFLALVGLTALLLGGIGVASAVHVFVKEKLPTIAVLRCLGARQRSVFLAYLLQASLLGLGGAALGVLLGIGIQALIPLFAQQFMPVTIGFKLDWLAIGAGLLVGAWVATVFALIPLLAVRDISPLQALRRDYENIGNGSIKARLAVYVALLASIVLLSVWQAPERIWGFWFAASIATTVALLWLTAILLVRATRRYFPRRAGYVVRQGISNLFRPHNQTVAITLSLGFGVFLIGTLYLVQRNLLDRIRLDERSNRPNLLLFDVQQGQGAGLREVLASHGASAPDITPMVMARIGAINGRPVADIMKDTGEARPEGWALRREYRNTYRSTLSDSEELIKGKWFDDARAPGTLPRISMEEELAEDLRVDIGDRITWDVQGVPVESRIASLRRVEWARFSPNFFVIFEPGVLDKAPQTIIALARVPDPRARAEVQRDLVQRYPNVSSLDLGLVQETLDSIVGKVSTVIRFLALFSILGGVIVLIGALTTSRFQRMRESALLKTLGAGRSQIGRILITEYFALGTLAGLTGMLLSVVAGWLLVRFFFEFDYAVPVLRMALLWAGVSVITVIIGVVNSRDVLRRPPLAVLREAAE
jgi:putative ABC transport system permease protein